MKPGLQLRTTTSVTLAPQLQQAIRLLQLSSAELQQELQQMLLDNPFLEQIEDGAYEAPAADETTLPDTASDGATDASSNEDEAWPPDSYALLADDKNSVALVNEHSDNWSDTADQGNTSAAESDAAEPDTADATDLALESPWSDEPAATFDDAGDATQANTQPQTLYDHLHQQALALHLNETDQAALYCLIESLNEDGYLEDSLAELAQSLLAQQAPALHDSAEEAEELFSEALHHLTVALRLLRTLDPPGLGARDLGECLRLQLQALPIADDAIQQLLAREVALELCQQPLEYLARRDIRQLQKLTPFSAPQIKAAMQLIATLEPKPGRRFAQTEHNIVVPDVLVTPDPEAPKNQPAWRVDVNPAVLPKVRVHALYASALRQHPGESSAPLQQRLQEARWMVKSLQQRFDTILRVSQMIVLLQQDFFDQGPQAMQPLALREVAQALELHESTISRVTSGKFMATPWGTFELKYFFSSALPGKGGHSTSGTAVRALLQQLIAEESPEQPLSDNRLCELLQEQGIQCARRTVAKYREALRIPPAHLRKTLQDN
ncbi:MAG: RNA polymerase factor sigma-54 [Brachymonas sp.]|nr:RNA polymerase factor sigma-54 [Brachymonas sp.]